MTPRQLGWFILGLVVMGVIFSGIHRFADRRGSSVTTNAVARAVYPPVPAGAGISTWDNEVPGRQVTLAKDGVARLPSGVTVTLRSVSPTPLDSPYGDQTVGRTLSFDIDASPSNHVSVMGYVLEPSEPDVFHPAQGKGGPIRWRMGKMSLDCKIGPGTLRMDSIVVPRSLHTKKVTYRLGVGKGEWKSVLDFPNPFYERGNIRRGIDPLGQVMVCGEPSFVLSSIPFVRIGAKTIKFPVSGRASVVVPRRAILLDSDGYVVGTTPTVSNDMISGPDLRRCSHILVQEREMEWAEFRDISLLAH